MFQRGHYCLVAGTGRVSKTHKTSRMARVAARPTRVVFRLFYTVLIGRVVLDQRFSWLKDGQTVEAVFGMFDGSLTLLIKG